MRLQLDRMKFYPSLKCKKQQQQQQQQLQQNKNNKKRTSRIDVCSILRTILQEVTFAASRFIDCSVAPCRHQPLLIDRNTVLVFHF